MAILTISRGCYSHGKEIAEKVAKTLNYERIDREILIEASNFFGVSEKALLKSVHDAPSVLERWGHGKEKYLKFIQVALLARAKKDNVVYHGHAGHLLLPQIGHVMKVRVIADMESRIEMLQSSLDMSYKEAAAHIEQEDKHRSRWTRLIYNVEIENPKLYDLVLNIGHLTIDDACDIICKAVRSDTFKATPDSLQAVNDMATKCHIEAAIHDICEAEVAVRDGVVHIKAHIRKIKKSGYIRPKMEAHVSQQIKTDLAAELCEVLGKIPDIKDVVYDIEAPSYA